MVLVRLLLCFALAAVAIALGMFAFTRDRRYLRFVGKVAQYTVVLLLAVLLFYAFARLLRGG